jgi:hypothetical protein
MTHLLLLLALVAADDPEPPKVRRAIDPTYTPKAGDIAFLDSRQKDTDGEPIASWAGASVQDYKTFVQLTNASNDAAIDRLEDDRKVFGFDPGTRVQVVEITMTELFRNEQGVAAFPCASVRILVGSEKGKLLYTDARELVQYVAASAEPPATPQPKRKAARGLRKKTPAETSAKPVADPAARAATSLRMAQSLEKAGKTKGALDLYRQLLKQYPASPQAKTAAERVKVLENP